MRAILADVNIHEGIAVLCRFAEWMVMISFIVLAMTWLTKKPGFFKGWSYLMPEHEMSVFTSCSLCVSSLLIYCCSLETSPVYL